MCEMIFFQILKILLKNAEMFCKTDKKKTSQPAGNQYFFFFQKKKCLIGFSLAIYCYFYGKIRVPENLASPPPLLKS